MPQPIDDGDLETAVHDCGAVLRYNATPILHGAVLRCPRCRETIRPLVTIHAVDSTRDPRRVEAVTPVDPSTRIEFTAVEVDE